MSDRSTATAFQCALAALLVACCSSAAAQTMNGFDLRGALVPADEIHSGGPEKDGIPAIDAPSFASAGIAGLVGADDQVLGLALDGEARAYPIRILNWHEVVNDRFGDRPVAVTFCPLCGTGVAFDPRVDGRELSFGVSGLLYNSDVLLYDRQTASLWSQLLGRAISGPLKGKTLAMLPLEHTIWGDWKRRHPATKVLSAASGPLRPYYRNPYDGYEKSDEIYFPVAFRSAGFHPKERVLGLALGGAHKAYPFVELDKAARRAASAVPGDTASHIPGDTATHNFALRDSVGGQTITIRFDPAARRATAHRADGAAIPAVVGFWFAWYAFHPQTAVYRDGEAAASTAKPVGNSR